MVEETAAESTPSNSAGPQAAGLHDDYSFDQLAAAYNLLNISSFARVFCNLIRSECENSPQPPRILDIGCGAGIGRDVSLQWEIKEKCGDFWGIEPDEGIVPEEGLFDHFQHALMETAELPEDSFDIAYSSMVMEHVADPVSYLTAVARCLKPGGVYLFLTPNAKSLVPWVTKVCHDLRIDELSLRLVRPSEKVDQYHYPVQFRCNTDRQIAGLARQLGFREPEFAYIEGEGARGYFPGPLRLIYSLLLIKRRLIKNPRRLVTMICRLTKA